MRRVSSKHELKENYKQNTRWVPEYAPESVVPPQQDDTINIEGLVRVSPMMLSSDIRTERKTKIVCTMGPKCWDEETMHQLLDAGMDVARMNFSHGSHEGHLEVLQRFRKAAAAKNPYAAALLDTKGPEIRTAMLRDHKRIDLEKGETVIVEAAGAAYTTFEGYKTDQETRIGLSYDKLCQSVKPGNRILIADGTISLRVEEILSDRELRATCLVSKKLGERKNCNLPGIKVDIPVLTEKDIDDLVNFGCKHGVDFVAASFVQSGEDVRFIRRVLDENGGADIQIISKIENEEALQNFDEILEETDGVMVARGDLGMEIAAEKVPLAQKMLIQKSNRAGKFCICATQMLENMIEAPLPTRGEMTDVANAVFDGTDATMLSGETANGAFPASAVRHMASIASEAEVAVDYYDQFKFLRYCHSWESISAAESVAASVVKSSIDLQEDKDGNGVVDANEGTVIVVVSSSGAQADLISKYRPPCPIVVVTDSKQVARHAAGRYGQRPLLVDSLKGSAQNLAGRAIAFAKEGGFLHAGMHVVVCHGASEACADAHPTAAVTTLEAAALSPQAPMRLRRATTTYQDFHARNFVSCQRNVTLDLELISEPDLTMPRAAKIVCTMGPKCWDTATISKLLDAGMNVARLNFSHGNHEGHKAVLDTLRTAYVAKAAEMQQSLGLKTKPTWSVLLDTKGPEIRTAMLRDHKAIEIEAGQTVIVEAVGAAYTSFEGYKTDEETRIGLSYDKLCKSVNPGSVILIADGTLSLKVEEIINDRELRALALNPKSLGERKNCNLPGVKIDIPVLTEKDIDDLVNFGCKYGVDYVAASFVQSAADVKHIRHVLDSHGGERIQIISKIENGAALDNFDEILKETDGVMVARGDLGMEVPSAKVPLAQKMLVAKANRAGKFCICATQMLESMISNPLPTRAEMTDVANAVFDGADATMLSGETANGDFPADAVAIMARISQNAQASIDYSRHFNHIRRFTPKPLKSLEGVCSSAVKASIDMGAALVAVSTNRYEPVAMLAKYRPRCPIVVATTDAKLAALCNTVCGVWPLLLEEDPQGKTLARIKYFAQRMCLADLKPGDGQSDQIVSVSSVSGSMEKTNMLFRCVVVGDEAADLYEAKGAYSGVDTISLKSTKVSLQTVCEPLRRAVRKTKIVCTMGPKCWDEETLVNLMRAGMNVARFNFSHGDHEGHGAVMDRVRAVAARENPQLAVLLDTKGPEIRTAMLRDHKAIEIEAGQTVIVEAVGAAYTSFEGYKTDEETRIGLSYDKLCQSVKVGNRILIADGTISLRVEEILSGTELRALALNTKTLGERKNCNLPGVRVEIPVLTEKDIDDLVKFGCARQVDYVAASFVQTGEDVRFIRRVLDENGGEGIMIISKIENEEGLHNIDAILEESDGIMVARGDLGMEIPPEKVPLAQKALITKANIAGKFCICATQMLESMISNPLPTRAEMTDVANAVFDGTDATMLSGETANGAFPADAVRIMSRIVADAEVGCNFEQGYTFVRDFTPKPMSTLESIVSSAAQSALDLRAGLIVVFTNYGRSSRLVSKYKPPVPVLLVTPNARTARQHASRFACYPMVVESDGAIDKLDYLLRDALEYAQKHQLCPDGSEVVVAHGTNEVWTDVNAVVEFALSPGEASPFISARRDELVSSYSCTRISLPNVLDPAMPFRKTKIVCTMGPKCWSEEGLGGLLDAGMTIARFNFSHGDHAGQGAVLERLRALCEARAAAGGREVSPEVAYMLDTKGPEIRTAMLRDHQAISLEAGQSVVVEAVGAAYTSFEGYKTDEETRIGLSYDKLCQSVKPGSVILIADGTISLRVDQIMSETEVCARCLVSKTLGERKNCNLPGIKVDIPVLTEKDIDDLVNFGCKHGVDFVAASFVQSGEDVRFIRRVLDENGGADIQIISKIENEEALQNFDEILEETDGVMVARGDLGMEIPAEKVPLAQKMLIQKANLAGKFVITATQMLESMISNPLPTRAEMTDVANAVFDGTDATMLSGETANGAFPADAVRTMARINASAELALDYYTKMSVMRDFTAPKPLSVAESVASSAAKAAIDGKAGLVVVVTARGDMSALVSKYRPSAPQVVVTPSKRTVAATMGSFGQVPLLVDEADFVCQAGGRHDLVTKALVERAVAFAKAAGVVQEGDCGKQVVCVVGKEGVDADDGPQLRVV